MKTQHVHSFAYLLGLAAVGWVTATAGPDHFLVTAMTILIGGVFTLGMLELRQHRSHLDAVGGLLTQCPSTRDDYNRWLESFPAHWRHPVRQRIEGLGAPFPAPALTPYLVGLLVMLGMLGTFLGMLGTLSGTAFALNGLQDIQGIRDAFAQPIQGLGLAFGASVAGVATSAMLGLMSTLLRRERTQLGVRMDHVTETLEPWSRRHLQAQQWQELLQQTRALPELVAQMGQWMDRMQDLQSQLNQQSLTRQEHHQQEVLQAHQVFTQSLSRILTDQWAQSTTQTIACLKSLEQKLSERWVDTTGQTLNSLQSLQRTLEQRLSESAQQSGAQLQALAQDGMQRMVEQTHATQHALIQAHEQGVLAQHELSAQHLARIETRLVEHLTQLGASLEDPLTRLIEVSRQAPQAAAEVIAELRQRINASMVRDNELLAERSHILDHLAQISHTFGEQVQMQGQQLRDLSGQLQGSALEVASLGQAFGQAVEGLQRSQTQTLSQLEAVQQALSQASNRSDDQLAYYVAQAREVVELSLSAQQPLLQALEHLLQRSPINVEAA
jgi:hypothetical protein